jgi:pyruvate carboxylase subunit B
MHVDSICLKDASGTTDPVTVYKTAVGLKKIMPPEMPLWMHTHDTAATGVACYMAGIHGGVDGVDLAIRPLAAGTSQPDARALAHSLKGTGYSLDMDVAKLAPIEAMLEESLSAYAFNPTTTTPDARVLGFPMPGGAIGPNVHMMEKAGILDRYAEVLAEFPVVVEAGGAWTSVTPGSQQYWLQAFNNVLYGRWEKIDAGYGKAVLGYFGRTPLPPDPDVVDQGLGAARARAVRRRSARCRSEQHPGGPRRARGARARDQRRERVPGPLVHGPRQADGGERGNPVADRDFEDRHPPEEGCG